MTNRHTPDQPDDRAADLAAGLTPDQLSIHQRLRADAAAAAPRADRDLAAFIGRAAADHPDAAPGAAAAAVGHPGSTPQSVARQPVRKISPANRSTATARRWLPVAAAAAVAAAVVAIAVPLSQHARQDSANSGGAVAASSSGRPAAGTGAENQAPTTLPVSRSGPVAPNADLHCPSAVDAPKPTDKAALVPHTPTVDTGDRMVPAGSPMAAVGCVYRFPNGKATGAVAATVPVTMDLAKLGEALWWMPVTGKDDKPPALASNEGDGVTVGLIGLRYPQGTVWVSEASRPAGEVLTTNGVNTSRSGLPATVLEMLYTSTPDSPAAPDAPYATPMSGLALPSEAAQSAAEPVQASASAVASATASGQPGTTVADESAPSPTPLTPCDLASGRFGTDRAVVPAGATAVALCGPGGPRASSRNADAIARLAAPLNAGKRAPANFAGLVCADRIYEPSELPITLVFQYQQGPTVSVYVKPGCGATNGMVQAPVSAGYTALVNKLLPQPTMKLPDLVGKTVDQARQLVFPDDGTGVPTVCDGRPRAKADERVLGDTLNSGAASADLKRRVTAQRPTAGTAITSDQRCDVIVTVK